MFRRCISCQADLGSNEALERFPVGRRLAFDAAKGRLWVVCSRCAQWNLSPLEERWEAIEEAEQLFRDSRKRVSTDEIGLRTIQDPVHVHDFHATLLALMGLDHKKLTYLFQGRDYRLTDVHGNTDLLAKLKA